MAITKTTWTASEVKVIIGGDVHVIIRMTSEQAVELYRILSLRAANHELYNKDGVFTIAGRTYALTAGQWASVYRTLSEWYEMYFDAFLADDLFASAPGGLRAVR